MNFIMHQAGVSDGVRDDYEQRLPRDRPGTECGPRARVWRVYNEEAREYDLWMVINLRENLDVLLVFATLFSAVVTTFVAQTSQSLQPDYGFQSSLFLAEMVRLQRAAINGAGAESAAITSAEALNPLPNRIDLWVNGLWFASLTLSLTTALLAALARQWLHYYMTVGHSGTPRDMCRLRHFRLTGMEQWRVPVIVGFLPLCLHLSLAIFLAGLIVFLWDLSRTLAYIVGVITGAAYVSYIGSIGLSMIFPNCPYRTGLSNIVFLLLRNFDALVTPIQALFVRKGKTRESDAAGVIGQLSVLQREKDAIRRMGCELDARMLRWLLETSSNPSVRAVVIQAIAGLPAKLDHPFLQSMFPASFGLEQDYKLLLGTCFEYRWGEGARPKWDCVNKAEQLLRFKRRLFLCGERLAPIRLPKKVEPTEWAFISTLIVSSLLPESTQGPNDLLRWLPRIMNCGSQSLEMWHELFKAVLVCREMRLPNDDRSTLPSRATVDLCSYFLWELGDMTIKRQFWIEDKRHLAPDDMERAMSFQTALLCPASGKRQCIYDLLRDHFIDVFHPFVDTNLRRSSPGLALILGVIRYQLHPDAIRTSAASHFLFALREMSGKAKLSHAESYAIFLTLDTIFKSGVLREASTPGYEVMCYNVLYIAHSFYLNSTAWHYPFVKHKCYWHIQHTWLLNGMHATLKTLTRGGSSLERGRPVEQNPGFISVLYATSQLIRSLAAYWMLDGCDAYALIENFVTMDGLEIVFRYKFCLSWFELMHAFVRCVAKLKTVNPSRGEELERYMFKPQNHFALTLCLIGSFGPQNAILASEADIQNACVTFAHLQPQAAVWTSTFESLDSFMGSVDSFTVGDRVLSLGKNLTMDHYHELSIKRIKDKMRPRIGFLKEQLSQFDTLSSTDDDYNPYWLGPRSSWTGNRGPDAILTSVPPPDIKDGSVICTSPSSPRPDLMDESVHAWKRKIPSISNNNSV